jgi:hypothetical protein
LAIKNHYTYQQWNKVVTFGVKWQQVVHHVTDHQLIPLWQCGGFPGREAHTPVLMEELMWDITRTSRRPLLHMDFDASSC